MLVELVFPNFSRRTEENPPIQQVIESDVVPCFIRFLDCNENASLQLEAVRVLTAIVKEGLVDHVERVDEASTVQIFIQLLSSSNEGIRAAAVLALGYIAGSTITYRDDVLQAGALDILLEHFNEQSPTTSLRNVSYTISRLCCGKPALSFSFTRPAVPLLIRLLYLQDMEIVNNACSALSAISEGSDYRDYRIEVILRENVNIVARLIEILLESTRVDVQRGALRVIGNIATGDDIQTQRVIEALPSFVWLLDHPDLNIRYEVCWTVSNITAGTTEQKQAVINSAIFPKVLEQLKSENLRLHQAVVWTIHALSDGTLDQVWYLIHEGSIPTLCYFLREVSCSYDVKLMNLVLESVENMLKVGDKTDKLEAVIRILSDCGGKEEIEKLQLHNTQRISSLAKRIVQTYFHSKNI